jgi:hypothetical protein
MKKAFLLPLCLIAFLVDANSQDYLLLDRNWKKPATPSNTITKDDINNGRYPIYKEDLDSLIIITNEFRNLKNDGINRRFYNPEVMKAGSFHYTIDNIRRTYGDGYEINLVSNVPEGSYTLKLSDSRLLLPKNQEWIRKFISYLELTKKNLTNPTKAKNK